MKAFAYIFLILSTFSNAPAFGDEQGAGSTDEYEVMIHEYLESEKDTHEIEMAPGSQVIIFDLDGNVTRQVNIDEDIELSVPSILKPVIHKAEFLTRINGIYYYICGSI
jgi:hypothetical protein